MAVSKMNESKFPTVAGISIPEVALLGVAGYVLWRNREKIQSLLEDNNIDVPSFLSADFSELIQSGASLIGEKTQKRSRSAIGTSRGHDA